MHTLIFDCDGNAYLQYCLKYKNITINLLFHSMSIHLYVFVFQVCTTCKITKIKFQLLPGRKSNELTITGCNLCHSEPV